MNLYSSSLAMVFYMALLGSSIVGQKLVIIFGLTISAGNILFPFTYAIILVAIQCYGVKQARMIIITGGICNLFIALFFFISIQVEPALSWKNQKIYEHFLSRSSYIIFHSTIAYFISEMTNIYVFTYFKRSLPNIGIISQAAISNFSAILIDTTIFIPVIFKYSKEQVIYVFASLVAFKLFLSLTLLPLVKLASKFLTKAEGTGKETPENVIPFSSMEYIKKIITVSY